MADGDDPKIPTKPGDKEQAEKDLAALRIETFKLKLKTKKDLKKAIDAEEARMSAGLSPGASEKLADLELKLVDLDEKIIKELMQFLSLIL